MPERHFIYVGDQATGSFKAVGDSALLALVARHARERLRLVSFILLLGCLLGLALNITVSVILVDIGTLPPAQGRYDPLLRISLMSMVPLCFVMRYLARGERLSDEPLIRVGLGFEVLIAAMLGAPQYLILDPTHGMLSWTTMWVILFPLLVPCSVRRTLVASFLAASTAPLLIWIGYETGHMNADSNLVTRAILANYVAVGMATAAASIIYRTEKLVHEKEEKLRRMGSYRLKRKLGGGQMGDIWLAEHEMLARPAAIKLIRYENIAKKWKGDPEELRVSVTERFHQEARATANLHSNHTVTVFDYGVTEDGTFYYVMELLDGMDMGQLVQEHGPISAPRMLHFVKQVCHSLAEAHQQGLVHRDIKPANIFVCKQGFEYDQVKVLDFGLVMRRHAEQEPQNVGSGGTNDEFMGTPYYVSPEQVTGTNNLDHRSDIYALGCVMYWLVTGSVPFQRKDPVNVLVAHVQETARPPKDVALEAGLEPIPDAVNELILDCLEKDPNDRPQDAHVLGDRIEAMFEDNRWKTADARNWWERIQPEG
jgi:serine/threonine-protein kinase